MSNDRFSIYSDFDSTLDESTNEDFSDPRDDRLRFHFRTGSLIKLSPDRRSAERMNSFDEFNNGVVMSNRCLKDDEFFEIRIEEMVSKWSGSIEIGVTTHDPDLLEFPQTMTNLHTGTIMMSGCGILINGKGSRREYGRCNLDELKNGDKVGLVRRQNGHLHYFINGLDQGVASTNVPHVVWGVIDLYGMTTKVTIVDHSHHVVSFHCDELLFDTVCGSAIQISEDRTVATKESNNPELDNGLVFSSRPLYDSDCFEVRFETAVPRCWEEIEFGVTAHEPASFGHPICMDNFRSGNTWLMNARTVSSRSQVVLDTLEAGDQLALIHTKEGNLYFYVNGRFLGDTYVNVPEIVYALLNLRSKHVRISLLVSCNSFVRSRHSSLTPLISTNDKFSFNEIHGKNVRLSANRHTATRIRAYSEFSDALVFSNRPIMPNETFEIRIDCLIDKWSGGIEMGLTVHKPTDTYSIPPTATELEELTWVLCGTTIFQNKTHAIYKYPIDLDALTQDMRIGISYNLNSDAFFYLNGVKQDVSFNIGPLLSSGYYAVINLYGPCSQISVLSECIPIQENNCNTSDLNYIKKSNSIKNIPKTSSLERYRKNVVLKSNNYEAVRIDGYSNSLIFTDSVLIANHSFELSITKLQELYIGSLRIGVTTLSPYKPGGLLPTNIEEIEAECWYLTGSDLKHNHEVSIYNYCPNLNYLIPGDRIAIRKNHLNELEFAINDEPLGIAAKNLPENLYIFVNLFGVCASVRIENPSNSNIQTPLNEQKFYCNIENNKDNNLSFHCNHGQNIELSDNKFTARRIKSYNHGIVAIKRSLKRGQILEISIDEIDTRWSSSLYCGILFKDPSEIKCDTTALNLSSDCLIVTDEWVMVNGTRVKSTYGQRLQTLMVGHNVGLKITTENRFEVLINDDSFGEFDFELPNVDCYPIFDLFGQCVQITIKKISDCGSSPQCEKASFEIAEKDQQSSSRFSVSLSSSIFSTNGFEETYQNFRESPSIITCSYLMKCIEFFDILFLPDSLFTAKLPNCYCINCYQFNEDDIVTKTSSLMGWVKFPIRNTNNNPIDNWHVAFYNTKPGLIRNILETNHLLTDYQQLNNNYVSQNETSNVKLYPCLRTAVADATCYEAITIFQIFVRPMSYIISQTDPEKAIWTLAKEANNISLNSLLIQLCDTQNQ